MWGGIIHAQNSSGAVRSGALRVLRVPHILARPSSAARRERNFTADGAIPDSVLRASGHRLPPWNASAAARRLRADRLASADVVSRVFRPARADCRRRRSGGARAVRKPDRRAESLPARIRGFSHSAGDRRRSDRFRLRIARIRRKIRPGTPFERLPRCTS